MLGWWGILIENIDRDEGWEEIYVAMQAARDKSGGENLFEVSRIILYRDFAFARTLWWVGVTTKENFQNLQFFFKTVMTPQRSNS